MDGTVAIALALVGGWLAQSAAATLALAWTLRLLRRPQPAFAAPAPPVLVVVPVRGAGPGLGRFLGALGAQDYPGPWRVAFAVESEDDPAHAVLAGFVATHPGRAVLLLAGPAAGRGQKVQNLRTALEAMRPGDAALVTLDADIVPPPDLLSRLLRPVLAGQAPIASGYRWSLPPDGDAAPAASRLLALADTALAALPRCARCNLCWGGATAIGRAALDRLDLRGVVWDRTLSDDLALTRAARAAGLPIYAPLDVRPPSPLPAGMGWRAAFGFGVRQYRVLRLHAPRAWWLALAAAALPVAGGTAALLLVAAFPPMPAVLALALALQRARAAQRAAIARRVLPASTAEQAARLQARGAFRLAPLVPLFHLACLLASSLGGRAVDWAGRRYVVDREGRVAAIGITGPG